ncbi:hypothetical protein [Leminorella grimontii]|uniref:hypothetical protein n=1 Tax=Leminorella grimontii TaxID=82981 RepID=UPI0032207FA2
MENGATYGHPAASRYSSKHGRTSYGSLPHQQERRQKKQNRIDYIGLILVIAGFGALQLFLDRYEINDGFSSLFIIAMAVTAALSLSLLS